MFDTGGLDIKPDSAMLLMKKDMGGAAQALGLAYMIMDTKLKVRLRVVIPAVENAVSGSAFRPLRTLIRFIGGDELDFEVQLILRREDVPACELGGSGEAAPQLGWLSWGKTEDMNRDPGEAVLQL